MIINQNGGGGGVALNFSLKAYAATPADAPAENTIGIVTTTEITDYTFSVTQPTARSDGTALSGGEIWIESGTGNTNISFNALKKDALIIYPDYVLQYVGGQWETKTAYIYQNGSWKSFALYLITGGIANNATQFGTLAVTSGAWGGTVIDPATGGYTRIRLTEPMSGNAAFTTAADISAFNTLRVRARTQYAEHAFAANPWRDNMFGVSVTSVPHSAYSALSASDFLASARCVSTADGGDIYDIDISAITRNAYLTFIVQASGGGITNYLDLYEVVLF